MWKPKGKRAQAAIKLGVWSGLLTWMVFFVGFGIVLASKAGRFLAVNPDFFWGFGNETFKLVLGWVVPIWIVFTSLMLVVVVARWVNRMLKKEEEVDEGS